MTFNPPYRTRPFFALHALPEPPRHSRFLLAYLAFTAHLAALLLCKYLQKPHCSSAAEAVFGMLLDTKATLQETLNNGYIAGHVGLGSTTSLKDVVDVIEPHMTLPFSISRLSILTVAIALAVTGYILQIFAGLVLIDEIGPECTVGSATGFLAGLIACFVKLALGTRVESKSASPAADVLATWILLTMLGAALGLLWPFTNIPRLFSWPSQIGERREEDV